MDSRATTDEASLRRVKSLTLPDSGSVSPGPLHTIVMDAMENLYYSDEINHSVTSLDREGRIRWQKSQRGNAPGEFYYPRGLSLGWTEKNGEFLNCLAVSDAWNRRVQFLDLEGNPQAIWTQGGDVPFNEVADVRFIPNVLDPAPSDIRSGFWYVLDRGNHHLCKMGLDGQLLSQIGRCFPPDLQNRWAVPRLIFRSREEGKISSDTFPPFDFFYFPERILGSSEETLYVWEPFAGSLKQILPPHLLPVFASYEKGLQWIAANHRSLLSWDRANRRLVRSGGARSQCDQVEVIGTPVPSNLSSNEFWLQNGNSIEKWLWNFPNGESKHETAGSYPLLARQAMAGTNRPSLADIQACVEACLAHMNEEFILVDVILARDSSGIDKPFVDWMPWHSSQFTAKCLWLSQKFQEVLHPWSLEQLERYIARIPCEMSAEATANLANLRSALSEQIRIELAGIQNRIDSLVARQPAGLAGVPNDPIPHDTWTTVALAAKTNMEFARKWIDEWSGIMTS